MSEERLHSMIWGLILSFGITYLICWIYKYPFGWNFKTVIIFMILEGLFSRSRLLYAIDINKTEIIKLERRISED